MTEHRFAVGLVFQVSSYFSMDSRVAHLEFFFAFLEWCEPSYHLQHSEGYDEDVDDYYHCSKPLYAYLVYIAVESTGEARVDELRNSRVGENPGQESTGQACNPVSSKNTQGIVQLEPGH